ncbi:MAG: SCO family protein [Rhodocyclaceae bacterium]|nr:SCO family protein [Rhodocyclaceae bacterium]
MPIPVRFLAVLAVALLAACSDARSPADAPAGGDFVLQSSAGPFDTRVLRGKVLILFFGYTNCPDICPTFLGNGAQALNRLSAAERARVRLVLVGVDPERDTPAGLKEYTAFFHPEMIGVTGSPAEIAAVAKLYGAGYVKQPARPDGSYAVDHSAQTYVVGPDGRLAATLDLGTPVDKVVDTVRKFL